MNTRRIWSPGLIIIGLAGMMIGAIDPLEGSVVILPSSGLVALGALVARSRWRILLYWAFALVAIGVAAMFVLSWFGGVGGTTGRSLWWLAVAVSYPVGWLMGLVGAVVTLIELFKHHAPAAPAGGAG